MAKVPPRNPSYSAADLWPPGSQGVEFPPAAFHPVYLGNFLCQQYSELVPRVQQYFASKGLLARMVFSRGADADPFRAYQDKTKLYDCLVYFTRPEDAQDAIKYLHRDKYFGHRLNIFPGRIPDRMDPNQTVVYKLTRLLIKLQTRKIEEHIQTVANVVIKSSKRVNKERLVVQFAGPDHRNRALAEYRFALTQSLDKCEASLGQQQNFLESDVVGEMSARMKKATAFMAMCPEKVVLEALYAGVKPDGVPMDWAVDSLWPIPAVVQPNDELLFKISQSTWQNFGVVCNFINKRTNKLLKQAKECAAKKTANKRMQKRVCNVKLPWQIATEK